MEIKVLLMLVTVLLIAAPAVCCAAGVEGFREYFRTEMQNHQRALDEAESVLREKDQSEWSQQELEAYLLNALYAISHATVVYIMDHRCNPRDWQELHEAGILARWPGNPLNDWQPMAWTGPGQPFAPGNLIKQLCPPSDYSFPENPTALSYLLTVNGTDAHYTPLQAIRYEPADWAVIPPGTAFVASFGWESAARTLKRREAKKARDEASREETKTNGSGTYDKED